MSEFKFRASKSLGQNYLVDQNIISKIIRSAALGEQDSVVEVGPGPGALTNQLISSPAHRVISIEKDKQFIDFWMEQASIQEKFMILHKDALKVSLKSLGLNAQVKVVANLPYNVGTQLILNWLGERECVQSMTLMLQKEVVERLSAQPGSKHYGRLSIIAQWLCTVKRLFDVPPTAFRPQPKVVSSVVQMIPRNSLLFEASQGSLEKITAAAFQQRRKMLKKSLKPLLGNAEEALQGLGIDPTKRPEELPIEAFCALARLLD